MNIFLKLICIHIFGLNSACIGRSYPKLISPISDIVNVNTFPCTITLNCTVDAGCHYHDISVSWYAGGQFTTLDTNDRYNITKYVELGTINLT